MRLIVVILGAHLSVGALYSLYSLLTDTAAISDVSTLTFGLGGVTYYIVYALFCLTVGLALIVSEFWNILWLEKIALMGYIGVRAYIVFTTMVSLGILPPSWLPNLAFLLIAATIRFSLRLKHQYE